MQSDHASIGACDLCGGVLPTDPIEIETGGVFCCSGCANIDSTLGYTSEPRDEGSSGSNHDVEAADYYPLRTGEKTSDTEPTETFLRVDGMQSTTCEAFLESVAEAAEGVRDAKASYVTETIRITYNSHRTSQSTLCEKLSTAGYTAVPREDAPIDTNAAIKPGDHQRESVLGYRYAAGLIFGSFLMLIYVVLLYPAHLASMLDDETLQMFAGGGGFGNGSGVLILPLFLAVTGVVLFFTGMPLLRGAYVSLRMRRPTTELLSGITVVGAYLYSTAAVLLGRTDVYFDLTIVVAALVVAAIFYESIVKQRAMDLLTDLTISQIDEARLYEPDGTTKTVPVEDLEDDDRILIRQGERAPVDGVLAEGECTVDEAVITGESLPIVKREGDDVVGGSVVTNGAAVMRVNDRTTSSIDRIVTTVWNLQSATHGVQRRANRLAAIIIPVVFVVAIIAGGGHLALNTNPVAAVLVVLTVLLVASPWALGYATPLSVATSIEEAMQRGIVIFDETIFERLRKIEVIVFDKTGTLTTGQMSVVEAEAPQELLEAAAVLERRASHPAVDAIVTAFAPENRDDDPVRPDGGGGDSHQEDQSEPIREFTTHSTGIEGSVGESRVLVGDFTLFEEQDWEVGDEIATRVSDARGFGRLPVIVGRDGQAEGVIVVGDEPREQWGETVTRLSEQGIETVVLTGDDEEAAEFLGRHPHVDHVFAGVPPAGKTAAIRRIQSDRYVTMVGDGTNDAPALAQADLGISLGSGTAIASDAADIAIVDDDLTTVETAFDLARAAHRRVTQNTALALLYNVITIPLAVTGLLNPLLVMAAAVATSGLLAANSFRGLLEE